MIDWLRFSVTKKFNLSAAEHHQERVCRLHRHHDRSQAQHHHGLQQDPRLVSGRDGRVRLTQEPAGQQEVRVLQHVQGR